MSVSMNVVIFILLLLTLVWLFSTKPDWSLARKTLIGLVAGLILGGALQLYYSANSETITATIPWLDVIGIGYMKLLQLIIMPLIFVSILSAVVKLHSSASSLGRISFLTIFILLFTTMIAAIISVIISLIFNLSADGLVHGTQEAARLLVIEQNHVQTLNDLSVPQIILSFVPKNIFFELTGANSTSIISVVLFSAILGVAALRLFNEDKQKGEYLINAIDVVQAWIMKLVRIVILLTPYGILALMTKMAMTSNIEDLMQLGTFIIASYAAIALMFIVHVALITLTGISPFRFIQNILPTLIFAFSSRSSAATIPMNIETQVSRFGVPNSIASFSASFGTTIGQNGCAGIYPTMLAVMVATSLGIDVFDLKWIATLIAVVTISSIGVAGVGGGATFAALIVLPIMGLPIELIALLISIEPLIDMGRTALNVSGSMVSGIMTSHLLGETDKTVHPHEQ